MGHFEKKNILHWLFLIIDVIYSFLPYFEARTAHSRTISLCLVIVTSATSNVCHMQMVSPYRDYFIYNTMNKTNIDKQVVVVGLFIYFIKLMVENLL